MSVRFRRYRGVSAEELNQLTAESLRFEIYLKRRLIESKDRYLDAQDAIARRIDRGYVV